MTLSEAKQALTRRLYRQPDGEDLVSMLGLNLPEPLAYPNRQEPKRRGYPHRKEGYIGGSKVG